MEMPGAEHSGKNAESTMRALLTDPGMLHTPGQVLTANDIGNMTTALAHLHDRILKHQDVPFGELRDVLRRAAAVLCRVKESQCSIARSLVEIPFAAFTKNAIKLGISLWMAVINEKPSMETRILIEVAANWEASVRKRIGIFDARLR